MTTEAEQTPVGRRRKSSLNTSRSSSSSTVSDAAAAKSGSGSSVSKKNSESETSSSSSSSSNVGGGGKGGKGGRDSVIASAPVLVPYKTGRPVVTEAQLILKWGGVLTRKGRQQAEAMGRWFRTHMYKSRSVTVNARVLHFPLAPLCLSFRLHDLLYRY